MGKQGSGAEVRRRLCDVLPYPGSLRRVHRRVCRVDYRFCIRTRRTAERDADARRDVNHMVPDMDWYRQCRRNACRNPRDHAHCGDIHQQYDEFVPTEPPDGIMDVPLSTQTYTLLQTLGSCGQHRIPGSVTMQVIHALEAIEVEK